jgi:hypothetical protein
MILKQLKMSEEQNQSENLEEQSQSENLETQTADGMMVEWRMQQHDHDHFPSWTLI